MRITHILHKAMVEAMAHCNMIGCKNGNVHARNLFVLIYNFLDIQSHIFFAHQEIPSTWSVFNTPYTKVMTIMLTTIH